MPGLASSASLRRREDPGHTRGVLRRRSPASAVIGLPIEREETLAIISYLMGMDAKLDNITRLIEEDDDGEEEDEL